MSVQTFINRLSTQPDSVQFSDTMEVITKNYIYSPSAFKNGDTHNELGTNEGSCKIFAFAQLNNLDQSQTLMCFGDYYRVDVLQHPKNDDHANIRNFIKFGWDGIEFEHAALTLK
ncbi:HopJ type III effector protein [Marinicellulosiphila megalodicopiae]|uniref:HopJ type III effector protein n=1 Tax=Marinicellulosiphila megalodicopiae TaxID=2724896 RepID=UPI003BB0820C